jgi:hypothetical protein
VNQEEEQAAIDFLHDHVGRTAEVSLEGDEWVFRWVAEYEDEPPGEQVLRVRRDDLATWWLQPGLTEEQRRQRHSDLLISMGEFYAYHAPSDGPVGFSDEGFWPISPREDYYEDPLRLNPG